MFATRLRRRSLVVAVVAAAGMLGACITIPAPGAPGNPGNPDPAPQPAPAQPQVVERTFNDPKVGGRWVDLCYAEGSCREQQQIDLFCQQKGYDEAVSSHSRNTVLAQTNVRLGDQSVCRSTGFGNCHRVVTVTCQRTG